MTITLGTQKQIDPDGDEARVVNLTATTAIAIYNDDNTNGIRARHLTLASGIITVGAEVTVEAVVGVSMRVTNLTSSSALLAYQVSIPAASKAVVLTVTGTTITVNAIKTLTDNGNHYDVATLTATKTIYTYRDASTNEGKARILSISGTTITENAAFTYAAAAINPRHNRLAALTTTKAVVNYRTQSSGRPTGQVLDVSGTTITGNTAYQLTTAAVSASNDRVAAKALTSTKYIYIFDNTSDGRPDALIVDEAATVLTSGALYNLGSATNTVGLELAALTASKAMAINKLGIFDNVEFFELDISGTVITITDEETVIDNNGTVNVGIAALDSTTTIGVWDGTTEGISAEVAGALGLAPMTKPADIDAAGEFIYVALLEGGTPILTKISTALDADGVTVFNPGAGDNIGVECGRFNSDVVWVAGAFDGTNVVEKSEDGGSSFTVKDDGTIGNVRTFVMGPDDDDKILVFDETNGDIRETWDDGASWTNINASVTPEVNAIARLGKNIEESVFGNDGGANNSINYSINSGDDLEDFQTGVYPNANATRVIVN